MTSHGPADGESSGAWLKRITAHSRSFAKAQADTLTGRRLVRRAISGKLTRRELFIEAFSVGYLFGIQAGMAAAEAEIAGLSARLDELEAKR